MNIISRGFTLFVWRQLALVALLFAAFLATSLITEKAVYAQNPGFVVERDVSVPAGRQGWAYWPVANQSSSPDTVTIIPSNSHVEDWFMSKPSDATIPPGYVLTLSLGCDASRLTPGIYYADFTLNNYSGVDQSGIPIYSIDDYVLKCTVTP